MGDISIDINFDYCVFLPKMMRIPIESQGGGGAQSLDRLLLVAGRQVCLHQHKHLHLHQLHLHHHVCLIITAVVNILM